MSFLFPRRRRNAGPSGAGNIARRSRAKRRVFFGVSRVFQSGVVGVVRCKLVQTAPIERKNDRTYLGTFFEHLGTMVGTST
jgi:hypothetical protein